MAHLGVLLSMGRESRAGLANGHDQSHLLVDGRNAADGRMDIGGNTAGCMENGDETRACDEHDAACPL